MLKEHPLIPDLLVSENGELITWRGKPLIVAVYKKTVKRVNVIGQTLTVSKLVCETYHGLRPNISYSIKRKDGNPNNYHYTNLFWGPHGGKGPVPAKLSQKDKQEIIRELKAGVMQKKIAEKYKVSAMTITRIKKKHINK
ncbi:MAG: hypothetical protein ACPGSD_07900 [Flavobacteriales bacterium]